MNCIECQRCCKWDNAVLSGDDIEAISSHLHLTPASFIDQYADADIELAHGVIAIRSDANGSGCIFLTDTGCSIYEVRPTKCAAFPRVEHLDAELSRICHIARDMDLEALTAKVSDCIKTSAFRFRGNVGYGIDYKLNKYFLLDEIGSLAVNDIICKGFVDIVNIAATYGVEQSMVSEDIALFLRQFIDNNSPNDQSEECHNDESFFSYFTENKIPLSATIEVTDACNEDCIHCYRPSPKREAWTIDLFTRTCAELSELGCLQIDFTGGEPFLKKGFVDYLKIADGHGFIISILTNATLIDDEAIRVLKNIKIRTIYVSLYSDIADIHDAITKLPGSFNTTVSTIRKLAKNNIPVFINAPIMAANKDSTAGIKRLADEIGLDVKFAYKITPSYNKSLQTKEMNVYSKQELMKNISDPKVALYSELIELKKSGQTVARDRIRYCDTGFRSITISPEGDIIPCTALRLGCGNITEAKIATLWAENTNMLYWREKGSLVKEECKSCSSYDFCEPCPAGYFAENNSLDGIDETTCGFGKIFNSCVTCS